mmetsp:Transcript_1060/g.3899  ORF Transcript_1060/g.3899 Transcript_1060/m.3899 type:complete len:213 (+) Transcript_1060:99-737(+)
MARKKARAGRTGAIRQSPDERLFLRRACRGAPAAAHLCENRCASLPPSSSMRQVRPRLKAIIMALNSPKSERPRRRSKTSPVISSRRPSSDAISSLIDEPGSAAASAASRCASVCAAYAVKSGVYSSLFSSQSSKTSQCAAQKFVCSSANASPSRISSSAPTSASKCRSWSVPASSAKISSASSSMARVHGAGAADSIDPRAAFGAPVVLFK